MYWLNNLTFTASSLESAFELENSQVEQDKKASEIDMAILGLMDTILTMQTQP